MKIISTKNGGRRLEAEDESMSDLLDGAVGDLERAIAAGYDVDMESWIAGNGRKICSVCLAGAVVALGLDGDRELCGWDTPIRMVNGGFITRTVMKQLIALDNMRYGRFVVAYEEMPGCGPVPTPSSLFDNLTALDALVADSGLSTDSDWAKIEQDDSVFQYRRIPGPMLGFYKDTIVPAMKEQGL